MGGSAEFAVTIGALACLGLALRQIVTLGKTLPHSTSAAQDRNSANRRSAVLMGYRQVFTLLIFGFASLLHPQEMVTTTLGFTFSVAFALFLLLRAYEHLSVPELRRTRDYLDLSLSLLAATFYGWAAALNRAL
jgi:hypothetical protein